MLCYVTWCDCLLDCLFGDPSKKVLHFNDLFNFFRFWLWLWCQLWVSINLVPLAVSTSCELSLFVTRAFFFFWKWHGWLKYCCAIIFCHFCCVNPLPRVVGCYHLTSRELFFVSVSRAFFCFRVPCFFFFFVVTSDTPRPSLHPSGLVSCPRWVVVFATSPCQSRNSGCGISWVVAASSLLTPA